MTAYGFCPGVSITGSLTINEEVSPTVRAQANNNIPAVAMRTAQTGANGSGVQSELAHTIDTTGPEAVAYAVRMRAGCDGGGKGALVQEGVSGTLATGNDQTIFQPVDSHHIEQGEDADSAQTLQIDENPNIMPVVLTQYGEEIAGTLRARYDSSPTPDNGQNAVVQPMVMASGHSHAEIGVGGIVPTLTAHNSKDAPILAASSSVIAMADDNGKTAVDVDMCGSLKVGGAPPSIAIQGDGTRSCGSQNGSWISGDGTSYTLNTIDRHSVMQPRATNGYVVRRLTPTECERLQGFPDGWTDIGEWTDSKGKKRKTTDGNRYKALGNSFAVPVVRWLGERIERIMMIEAGNNYRKARMAAEVKAERAATELGVSITTLFNWERGDTMPNAKNIRDMAQLYKVSADYLISMA